MTDETSDRQQLRAAFLKSAGWAEATAQPLTADASTRTYERVTHGQKRALLMNAPPGEETAPCPPDATPEDRAGLGYNALARLAGPNLNAFIAVSDILRSAGLSAPEVYAADATSGFALIEDLGDALFARAIPAGADEDTLYKHAIDALITLRKANPAPPNSPSYAMQSYDRVAMEAEVALLPDWYWQHKTNAAPGDTVEDQYIAAWDEVFGHLSTPHVIALRDFHAENLLWIPGKNGVQKVGLIDFQDGLLGHAAYDLVSLLEDARRDVSPSLAAKMLNYYCEQAAPLPDFDEERLRSDYAILGGQRNAKILGVFARLVHRDHKQRYLQFMPRVEAHFKNNLQHPSLKPLREFFNEHLAELAP